MSILTLNLSDTQLHQLERLVHQRGTSLEALVRQVLEDFTVQSDASIENDPLFQMQAHETTAPADLSQHADHYLYGAPRA